MTAGGSVGVSGIASRVATSARTFKAIRIAADSPAVAWELIAHGFGFLTVVFDVLWSMDGMKGSTSSVRPSAGEPSAACEPEFVAPVDDLC